MSSCKLCDNTDRLIKAHVIPKWAFKYLYPTDSEEKKQSLILTKKGSVKRSPVGPYDPEILCATCDGFLGELDNYGKKVLLDTEFSSYGENFFLKGADLEKIRLFLLSVLWRAGVSKREEFSGVSLGPYEQRIKQLLERYHQKEMVNTANYGFLLTKFDDRGDLPEGIADRIIQTPWTHKFGDINAATLYLPRGLKIILKLDQREFPKGLQIPASHANGLLVIRMGSYANSNEFKALMELL